MVEVCPLQMLGMQQQCCRQSRLAWLLLAVVLSSAFLAEDKLEET